MHVFMTGGTGFIGYHTAQALLAAGCDLTLLVRDPAKLRGLFGRRVRHVTGDITDTGQVRKAVRGCDAAVHVAALVSTHAADQQRVFRTNTLGTRNVIGSALDAGASRVIHVSSVTALYDPAASRLDEQSPPGTGRVGYGRSKVACEKYARRLQRQGAPVTITYPASVLGPDSPGLTEAHQGLATCATGVIPLMDSGNQYVDVRDIATVHRMILHGDAPSNRYVLGGHYVPWRELGPLLASVTGRRPLQLPMSGAMMRLAGGLVDRLRPLVDLDLPLTAEGATYATRWVPMDSSRVERELDFRFRPVAETLAGSLRWMRDKGYVSQAAAGNL